MSDQGGDDRAYSAAVRAVGKLGKRDLAYIRRCRIKAYSAALVGDPRDSDFFMLCVRSAEGRDAEQERVKRALLDDPVRSL